MGAVNKFFKMYQTFEEQINTLIAGVVAILLTSAAAFFRKLPQYYIEAKQKRHFDETQQLDIILDDLVEDTRAIYGHIIKYHDGHKELKPGSNWRMTVVWEALGKPCVSCANSDCIYKQFPRKRLQSDWDDVPVTSSWFKVVSKAYLDPQHCHVTSIEDKILGDTEKEIFRNSGIKTYVEILIKVKGMRFYTLGLSFCENHEGLDNYSDIVIAGRKLYKLL